MKAPRIPFPVVISMLLICIAMMLLVLSLSVRLAHGEEPSASTADELRLQIVLLKSQLAQALNLAAKCEHEGSQSAKISQDAGSAAQTLIKDLDARGLMVDPRTNTIVAKPKAEAPPPASQP